MEFHIARGARERYRVDESLFNYVGNVVFADVLGSRRLAARMTEVRVADGMTAVEATVNAGALFAMGLIDELSHAVVAKYRETVDPEVLRAALGWFASGVTEAGMTGLLRSFTARFPNTAIYRGDETVEEWLAKTTEDQPNREAALEELMLLWLANLNPAYKPFKELFDDAPLAQETSYTQVTAGLGDYFATRPPFSAEGTLLDVLKAPMLASPDSLSGQLDFIREHWVEFIGDELRQVLLAIDVLREEEIAIWTRFHPAPGGGGGFGEDGKRDWGMFGFAGDEYHGFDDLRHAEEAKRQAYLAAQGAAEPVEYEAFSQDQAWMPTVVLIAKSTYVWLEQLSKQYGRHIHRLDQIPEEELRTLAGRGMNGLWLIGLWERSIASQTIKRMRGQHDAVASAYSLKDYRIAEDLGGERAYEVLRDRARAAGIRLASDMVPNHMGIDSTWVIEHPDWFVSRPQSPFPVYSFHGPDLSPDGRAEIRIEDHYYDQTDAAVVFELKQRGSGQTDYVYHGNDGTTFAWNDTAQLDYSKAYVREQVIQVILQVARQFPIIRFDAAMVLAKKHVQRLWFPLPGEGRSIPSRAENAMSQADFDGLMPNEFWREVVDRVAVEVPGTLLLAEAFWLLEGYFVRTLGMHRVYNSAFMNMLRDEENAKYRSYLKKTIEFDPDILKRYVNFMSNPDERTAIDQFGSGDKYFGCCTLMATLPGLPMFGHGQVEAYTERYGMEYKQAKYDEWPNEDLVARHQREITPLLKNRGLFAESGFFRMYDFQTENGDVNENVFAFSNREGGRRAVILFNNAYESTYGTIHWSVEQVDKGSGIMRGETLGDAVRLPWDERALLGFRDSATGLEYLRWSHDLRHNGITMPLRGYQYAVMLDWRELHSSAEQPWDRLCDALQGGGVGNLDEALSKLRLMPVHEALRQMFVPPMVERLIAVSGEWKTDVSGAVTPMESKAKRAELHPRMRELADRVSGFYRAAEELGELVEKASRPANSTDQGENADLPPVSRRRQIEEALGGVSMVLTLERKAGEPHDTAHGTAGAAKVLAWGVLLPIGADGEERLAAFDRLQLRPALAQAFSSLGFDQDASWRGVAQVRTLLRFGRPATGETLLEVPGGFWSDADVRWLTGFNEGGGKSYFNKEKLDEMLGWLAVPTLAAHAGIVPGISGQVVAARAAAKKAGYEVGAFLAATKATTRGATGNGTKAATNAVTKAAAETDPDAEESSQQTGAPEEVSETVEEAADPAFRA